jgi:enoyl-[acyl-carrier protein] reductase I
MLRGRSALVLGLANSRSLAWHIATQWRKEGANVFVTYQDERFAKPVLSLLHAEWGPYSSTLPLPAAACDVSDDGAVCSLFSALESRKFCSAAADGPKIDCVLHSIAHAPAEAMKSGTLLQTSRQDYLSAHAVSAYSLISVCRTALPYLSSSASVIAMTYIGSCRTAPNYNVMGPAKASLESCARGLANELGGRGVRVNCLSPGPVRTLAARGVRDFDDMAQGVKDKSPLRRLATGSEIAGEKVTAPQSDEFPC